MSVYDEILSQVKLPDLYLMERTFPGKEITDISQEIHLQIDALSCREKIRGKVIALAVGSRGIANLPVIVSSVVKKLRLLGAKDVYIVPAMGSHGGAIAENQKKMLANLGVREDTVGAPVRASMETVILGYTDDGVPVHFDKLASQADYTVSIARVKPHCSFRGKFESGMVKMSVIGLGKQRGADICHKQGMQNMGLNLEKIGRVSLEKSNLLFCLGLIENAYDQTCRIFAVPKEEIMAREPALLAEATELLPQIPFENLDLLVVCEIGKNITGTGMDCNIVKRFTSEHMKVEPLTKRLVVLSLTKESDGNAAGIGLADVTTRSVFENMSMEKTYPNFLTSRTPNGCRIPMVMENEEMAIRAALKMCVSPTVDHPRVVIIRNTLEMSRMMISEALIDEAKMIDGATVAQQGGAMHFDDEHKLICFDT